MNEAINIISLIVSFLLGGLSGALIHYLNQKGKNLALKEDMHKLEEEKQAVILKKDLQLEEQKKEFALEIEKKKYQYESKKSEYKRFAEYIDTFNGVQFEVLQNDFAPIMQAYYQAMALGYDSIAEEKTIEFNDKCISALSSLREQEAKLFSQVTSLKLSASPEVDSVMSNLLSEIQTTNKFFTAILEKLGEPEFQVHNSIPDELLNKGNGSHEKITNLRTELLNVMKQDLNSI
ncbi:hypothetical protein L9W80_18265 [Vibrio aestuarianus]|uniref:hypothetical protein n=1 Tax=Vibrio aestuarianus TaxID=28171 RepID=UPI00237CBAE2|nr:hypothetical protein [Vibrio aestuarianus]MDE1352086.1 hypothetical protein [Vibrio aestuarianus]